MKTKPQRKSPAQPEFITKTEIALHLGVSDLSTIDAWVREGSIPRPHSRPGVRFAVWRRKHWNAYVETGSWPSEAFAEKGPS